MVLGTLMENISIDNTFTKNIPKDVRGTMFSVYTFCGNLGILFFSKSAGYLFKEVGPKAPFTVVISMDILFALVVIVLRLTGKLDK